jgi:hypothetical protein
MTTRYIYSNSYIRALEGMLLTRADVDRLVSIENEADYTRALNDTFLAPHLRDDDVDAALIAYVQSGRALLRRIAPTPAIAELLWLQDDMRDLRLAAKEIALGEDPSVEVEEVLLAHPRWTPAYTEAISLLQNSQVKQAEQTLDLLYEATIGRRLSEATGFPVTTALLDAKLAALWYKQALRSNDEARIDDTRTSLRAIPYFVAAVEAFDNGDVYPLSVALELYPYQAAKRTVTGAFGFGVLVQFYARIVTSATVVRTLKVAVAATTPNEVKRDLIAPYTALMYEF